MKGGTISDGELSIWPELVYTHNGLYVRLSATDIFNIMSVVTSISGHGGHSRRGGAVRVVRSLTASDHQLSV